MTSRSVSDGAILRPACRGDESGILACIRNLAAYEGEADAVDNTVDALTATLFDDDPRTFASLAAVCVARGYARLEWTVLDWNEPAIAFYRLLGAEPMSAWTTQRLTGVDLSTLAEAL